MTEQQQEIIRRMCEGESLRSICRTEGFPTSSAVIQWMEKDEAFAKHYARAMETRADVYFDRIDEVSTAAESAENAVQVAGLRLKADNIKWQLARMAPKKYGDKIETTHAGVIGIQAITRTVIDPKEPQGQS
jgi:hypothetical protein